MYLPEKVDFLYKSKIIFLSAFIALEILNSLHERIQFTLEVGESNRLHFLDVTAINTG